MVFLKLNVASKQESAYLNSDTMISVHTSDTLYRSAKFETLALSSLPLGPTILLQSACSPNALAFHSLTKRYKVSTPGKNAKFPGNPFFELKISRGLQWQL